MSILTFDDRLALDGCPVTADKDSWILGLKHQHELMVRLVAEGRLRVVEEAELVSNTYDCLLDCTRCKEGVPYYVLEGFKEINFCPNCGSPIKKA